MQSSPLTIVETRLIASLQCPMPHAQKKEATDAAPRENQ